MKTPLRFAIFALVFFSLAGCAGSRQAGMSADGGPAYLYVANQGGASVSVIDTEKLEVVHTVDLQQLGFSADAKPHHVAVEPNGQYWYVSLIGESRVVKFNRNNEMVGSVEFETPGMLALDPGTDELFVGRSMTAVNPPSRIGIIQRGEMTVDEIDVFFPRPHALLISPDGKTVYTASLAENKIMAVDVASEETKLTDLGGSNRSFVQFAISPDGKTMVAGGHLDAQMSFFDISDPTNPRHLGAVSVNHGPWHPVYSADGRYIYFGNKMHNTITIVDAADRSIARIIEGPSVSQPHGSALSPDGRYVFISNQNGDGSFTPSSGNPADGTGNIVVIDTSTNEIVKTIEVGKNPSGIGIRPR